MSGQKPTVCQICACNCGILATIDEGRIVKVEGDPNTPQNQGGLCTKGKMSPSILYAPGRLKTPLIRSKNSSSFVPVSWDDALDEIADRLQKTKEKNGPESLAIYRGRPTRFIERAFINAFARLFETPNVTGVWSLCVGPKIVGYQATYGTKLIARSDFRNAKLIVLWGTNPAVSKMHRYFNLPNDIRTAVKRGAELVVIDPRRHRFAEKATLHLAITPGTDTYLILALIKILVARGWTDNSYIQAYTSGYEQLCKAASRVDLKMAAAKTGISLDAIINLAEKLGTLKPASIDRREGVIHQANGTQINRALAILAAITGNADVPGGLRFFKPSSWNTSLGIEDKVEIPPIWSARYPLAADGVQTLTEAMLEGKPYPIRALISIAGNLVSTLPNTRRTLAALKKLDFLVVNDLFMTEMAQMADIVLPGVTFYEKGELYDEPLKPVPWLQTTEPLVEPCADSKPEWRFIEELASRMGWQNLSGFSNEDEVLKRIFRDSGRPDLNPVAMRGGIRTSPPSFGGLLENGFNTPSGKIELYSNWFAQKGYASLPVCEDVCSSSAQYPYRLVTGSRVGPFNHSQHRNIPELLRRCPHPVAEIPPEIATGVGVSDGELVTVETEWGCILIRSKIVKGMNPVTISIPHGWPKEENVNYLTNDNSRDPIAGTPAYKAIPCLIRKAKP